MPDDSVNAQSTFEDWDRWFTLNGLYLDSSAGVAGAFRSLADDITLADMEVVWEWVKAKRGLDSPESYFLAQVSKPSKFRKLIAKVRMFQSDGSKPAMRNMNPNQDDHETKIRNEWIAAVVQERRTVEWVMRKEMMFRSEVLSVLKQLAPYVLTEEMYEGENSPWDLPDVIVENWRREDESDVLKAERDALFHTAIERKAARRKALNHPVPGERNRNGQPVTPEDIDLADVI